MTPTILLDANLPILMVGGRTDPALLGTHKHLKKLDKSDFRLLCDILASKKILLCPNVVTEASNLLRQHGDPEVVANCTRELARLVGESSESYVFSQIALGRPEAERLGVADAVLLQLAATGATLLTTDFDLFGAARRAGYRSENFNHLRDSRAGFRN